MSLTVEDGVVQVLFATIALETGVDMKGVNNIVHCGAHLED